MPVHKISIFKRISFKCYILLLALLVGNTGLFSQKKTSDSAIYKELILLYEKKSPTDRAQGLEIADKIEKLSIQQNNHFFLSDAYCKKAVMYYFNNDYQRSFYYAEKATVGARKNGNYPVLLKATNLLGAINYVKGNLLLAEKYYLDKIRIAKQIKDTASEMGTYYNIGLIYFQQGKYLKSADNNFIALKYFEQKKDTFNVLSSLQSIGYTYKTLADVNTSLVYYSKALKLAKYYKDNYQLAGIYIDMADIYSLLGKKDSGFYYIDLALKVSSKNKDDFHFAIATNDKANFYLNHKNYDQALILAKQVEILETKSDHKLTLCDIYTTISTIYVFKNMPDSAIKYGYKAYYIGLEMDKVNLLYKSTKTLANAFDAKNNSDSALKYYKLYSVFNDTLKKENQLRGIAQKEFIYEKQIQENLRSKEQLLANTKIEKQKQINLIVLIASLILLIFLIIGIINYRQKQKANTLVLIQKKLLEEKNKEVADSINYASRIQKSIMPDEKSIELLLPNSFVFYLPKDVVSGDFYWINSLKNSTGGTFQVLAVADCTGHGVPGAFMSLIGATILNQTIGKPEITNPAEALDFLNIELPKNIKGSSSSVTIKDGMEICMCTIDRDKNELMFAGANNNLYMIRDNKLILYKGDKRPIGEGYGTNPGFTNHIIPVIKNDVFFLSTDGYPDQFGGKQGKKFKYKQMEELFLSIHSLPVLKQTEILKEKFTLWKGGLDQVDDVLVMGFKI